MPDISMCVGAKLPICETCYRRNATPTPHWQSFFGEPPAKDGKCDSYWPDKREQKP